MIKFPSSKRHSLANTKMPLRSIFTFCLLSVLVFIIYSNSFQASWHFDDYQNIESNPRIQIKDLTPSALYLSFFASPENRHKPFRSVAYLSFAINAYFGGKNVIGYHAVNLAVHVITAFMLFLTVLKIYETPKLVHRSPDDSFFVALLTSVLWAVNPIQTQAITYIVQRMAALAAMFYIISLYLYIAGRLAEKGNKRGGLFIGCGISFVLAIMCKENAALLPLSLLFIEFIFFRDCSDSKEIRLLVILVATGVFGVITIGTLLFGNPFGFLNGYPTRTFTPIERLLTEARVVIHYLTQIFYPVPTRLSLYHDFTVSQSFFKPWTTLPSIIVILSVIVLGLKWMASRPLLSFAILFFFINHLVESTVIGLELVFEHRNYLPSLFIFTPVAIGLHRLITYYSRNNVLMHRVVVLGIILLVIGLGTGTYIRNQAWATERTLWEDTLKKAPNSIRAHHELAYQYYEKTGNYDAALILYHRGLDRGGQNIFEKTLSLNNIASIYFTRGDYAKAEYYWKEAIDSYPKYKQAHYRLALAQTRMGKWNNARDTLTAVMDRGYINIDSLRLMGIILLNEKKPEIAADYFRKCIRINTHDWKSLMYLGVVFSMMDDNEKAYRFLRMSLSERPKEPIIHLLLAENRLISKDKVASQFHIEKLINLLGPRHIEKYLQKVTKQYKFINFSAFEIRSLVGEKIERIADDLRQVAMQVKDIPENQENSSITIDSQHRAIAMDRE